MNNLNFSGRIAAAPVLTGNGDNAVCKVTLIRNEYAGKDDSGERREKTVAIQFTAFRAKGEAIAKHCRKGDQLIVTAKVSNNNYTDKDDNEVYGFNFVIDDFEFGAPGEAKREELAGQAAPAPAPAKAGKGKKQ